MRILNPSGGPGPGYSHPRLGLVHGFFHNLCSALCSCVYVFCCCWLLEDCLVGQRSFPGPQFGYPGGPEPPPAPPPHIGPAPHGPFGGLFGPSGPQRQPGPVGYPGEPPPY